MSAATSVLAARHISAMGRWWTVFLATLLARATAAGSRRSFLNSSRLALEESSKAEPSGAVQVTLESYFMFQRVGVQDSTPAMPRSVLDDKSNWCLTAGGADDLAGQALSMEKCEHHSMPYYDPQKQEMQAFSLLVDGKIRAKMSGYCVRRMLCGLMPVYDLGPCDEERTTVKWTMNKVIANDMTRQQNVGYPIQAVAKDICDMCGPYQMLQLCKGKPMQLGCDDGTKLEPGWTKLPSAYGEVNQRVGREVGPIEALMGGAEVVEDATGLRQDVDGMGSLTGDNAQGSAGLCRSFVEDAPSETSYWYLHKIPKKK